MNTQWLVSPGNAETNQLIARTEGLNITEENFCPETVCADGKRRNLILCPLGWPSIYQLLKNERQLHLDIKIFKKEGTKAPEEELVLVPKTRAHLYPKRKKQNAATAAA